MGLPPSDRTRKSRQADALHSRAAGRVHRRAHRRGGPMSAHGMPHLKRACELRGPTRRCATAPRCACQWIDRYWIKGQEVREELGYRPRTSALELAQKKRRERADVADGLVPPPKDVVTLHALV